MTDEERQKLVARLRSHEVVMWTDIDLAADEIERVAPLVQSNAEPDSKLEELVSRWEALKDGGGPSASQDVLQEELLTIISLARKGLTAPPRPDASAKSELETAADLLEQLAHELVATNERLVQLEARLEALERM
jgi:multidrug resistance efflux pump